MAYCMGCMEEINEKYNICPYCGYEVGTSAREAYHMPPGTVLQERYMVGKVIGYGGFGVTYIGLDMVLKKKVAVKEYLPGELSTRIPGQTKLTIFPDEKAEQFTQGVKKFVNEARRLAKFQHEEHIVKILDTFNENDTAYIIMEFLEGETLKERLQREGSFSVETALQIVLPVAEALVQVHREGIIHRDISPDNIFITKDACVKLLDFGAARSAMTGYSKSLSVIVKPGFAPAEQYRSRGEQGPWTDVYALSATMYQMITGQVPVEAMERIRQDTLKPPSKLGVKLSKGMENALMNGLQIDLKNRTQNMQDFIRELKNEDTKLKKIKEKKEDVGRWTLFMKLGVGTATAVVVMLAMLLSAGVFDRDRSADVAYQVVPDLGGMEYTQAEQMLSKLGVGLSQSAYNFSDTMAENVILTQSVAAGVDVSDLVDTGQIIEVSVSLGKERRVIGDITGFMPEQAEQKLSGFQYDISKETVESELAPGTIVSVQGEEGQKIDLETELGVGNYLNVITSVGNPEYDTNVKTQVPQLVGTTFAEARQLIAEAHLYLARVEEQPSDTIPKGSIISVWDTNGVQAQDGGAIQEVPEGTVVSVVVSSGEFPKVAIPNVLECSEEEARQIIEAAGLTVKVSYEENSLVDKGKVIRTSPQVGEQVNAGSEIELVISSGKPERKQKSDKPKKSKRQPTTEEKKKTTEKPPVTEKTPEEDDEKPPATEQNPD